MRVSIFRCPFHKLAAIYISQHIFNKPPKMATRPHLPLPPGTHFSLANIPFGIISTSTLPPRPAVAIGAYALDLQTFAHHGGFVGIPMSEHLHVFTSPTLNAFASLGRPIHNLVRTYLQSILDPSFTPGHHAHIDSALARSFLPLAAVTMHLPMRIGDYTDFYAGANHAHNCGVIFRGPAAALQPNYTHLPVGYHGRASSVVVSGTPIRRPNGQVLPPSSMVEGAEKRPELAPTQRLDIELELGAFLCKANAMGEPVRIADAEASIFGYVLLNDWSARDVQALEAVPLGPFTSKNFGTSVSAWVVLADALAPFACRGLGEGREVLRYLAEGRAENVFDLRLEVDLTSEFVCFQGWRVVGWGERGESGADG